MLMAIARASVAFERLQRASRQGLKRAPAFVWLRACCWDLALSRVRQPREEAAPAAGCRQLPWLPFPGRSQSIGDDMRLATWRRTTRQRSNVDCVIAARTKGSLGLSIHHSVTASLRIHAKVALRTRSMPRPYARFAVASTGVASARRRGLRASFKIVEDHASISLDFAGRI
jgi:hypothetical protein